MLLEDKKTDKLDLRFTPNQSFTSEKVAKDFSALLALWHFQVLILSCISSVSEQWIENTSIREQAAGAVQNHLAGYVGRR